MKDKVFECKTCGKKFGENPSVWDLLDHWKIHYPGGPSGTYQPRFERHSEQLKFTFQKIIKKNDESAAVESISKSRDSACEIRRRKVAFVIDSERLSNLSDFMSNSNTSRTSRQNFYDPITSSNRFDQNSGVEPRTLLQCRKCGSKMSSFIASRSHYESHNLEEAHIQTASNTIDETLSHALRTTSENVTARNPETMENNPVSSDQTSPVATRHSATIELIRIRALQQLTSCPDTRQEASNPKTAVVIQSLSQDKEASNSKTAVFIQSLSQDKEASNPKTAVIIQSLSQDKEASNSKTAVVQSLSQDMEQLDAPHEENVDKLDRSFSGQCSLTTENLVGQPDKKMDTGNENCDSKTTDSTQMETQDVIKISGSVVEHSTPIPLSYTEKEMLAAKTASSTILESGRTDNAESEHLKNEANKTKEVAEESHFTEKSMSENTTARPTTSSPRNQTEDRGPSRNALDILTANSSDSAKETANVLPLPIGSPKGTENEQSFELFADPLSEIIAASESAKGEENAAETRRNKEEEIRIVDLASSATGSAEKRAKRSVDVALDAETKDTASESIMRTSPANLRPDLQSNNPTSKQNKKDRKNKTILKENQQKFIKPQGKGRRGGPKKTRMRLLQSSSLNDSNSERTREVLNKTKPPVNSISNGKTAKKASQKSAWDDLFWNSTKDTAYTAQTLPDLRISQSTSTLGDSVSTDSSFEDANFSHSAQKPENVVHAMAVSDKTGISSYITDCLRAEITKSEEYGYNELSLQEKIRDTTLGPLNRPPNLTHKKITMEAPFVTPSVESPQTIPQTVCSTSADHSPTTPRTQKTKVVYQSRKRRLLESLHGTL